MEETISKTHIIILALMYNYISNKSDALKIRQIDDFISLIDLKLYNDGNNFISTEEENQNIYHYDISNKNVLLNNEDYFVSDANDYINTISKHIICISLKDDILCTLGVNKDKIKIVTSYERVNSFIDVFALGQSDALNKAKGCLEAYGYKNIEFHTAYPEQKYGDKSYHVIVSYDMEKLSFDTSSEKTFIRSLTIKSQVLFNRKI